MTERRENLRDSFDLSLANSGSLVKKGYSFLLANVGKTVALITLAVVSLVSFTEISFSEFGSESFTGNLVMMLIASYIIYFSLEDAGAKLGRESDEYKNASETYSALREKVKGHDIAKLRAFCLEYGNAELEYRRSNALFTLGYTEEEYKDFLNGKEMSKKAKKELGRVRKMKRAELSAASLLSGVGVQESELRDPKSLHLYRMILKLIPSTVCMLFTVSVMISTKDNLSVAGIIGIILKISTLPVIGLKGYSGGYEYATEEEKSWLETKTSLLSSFLRANKET